MAKKSGFQRETWFLIAAIALLLSPALFDIEWLAEATAPFQNTRDALFGVLGVFVTAGLINLWNKRRAEKRDKLRFDGMSTVAFRSLAQAVNDAGRMILAPVVGADLHAAGIPGFSPADHQRNLNQLRAIDIDPDFSPQSGVWDEAVHGHALEEVLLRLCALDGFPEQMFRTTSAARRRLQTAMAEWAPVLVAVPGANEQLGYGWPLADQIVRLLESWRTLKTVIASGQDRDAALDRVAAEYVETIRQYQAAIAELVPLSRLPTP